MDVFEWIKVMRLLKEEIELLKSEVERLETKIEELKASDDSAGKQVA